MRFFIRLWGIWDRERNINHFPQDFIFQLSKDEFDCILISQFVISSLEFLERKNLYICQCLTGFPDDFMFQLSDSEWQNLKSQNAIARLGGRRTPAFPKTQL